MLDKHTHKYLTFSLTCCSNNQGALGAAKFISSIVKHADKIVAIDAKYNLMPMESLSVISSGLKDSKGGYLRIFSLEIWKILFIYFTRVLPSTGRLEHLDLAGNTFCHQLTDEDSGLAQLQIHGQFALNVVLSAAPHVPYDNDP